jgi:hypothetical protein
MSDGKIRVDVPPLAESTWQRVEKGVFERLPAEVEGPRAAAARLPVWIAAAASLALVGICAFVWWPHHSTAPIAWPAPSTTAAASTTSHIVTTDAPASVSFGESSLDVGPASELVATGDDGHGVLVVLERGSVKLHVPPRAGRPPLSVLAGSVRVQVMGTRFSVERNGSDVRVHVDDGTVQVTNGADVVLVHASESWPTPPSAPTVAHSAPAPKIDDEAAFERAARSERTDPDGALRLYEGIVARGGAWAPNALYAEGRLELDRGHTANGRRLLELYLKRYPRGTNAADAKSLLEK